MAKKVLIPREYHALRVKQWMQRWDDLHFDTTAHRRKPDEHFYVFSLPASILRALSGISRRQIRQGVPRSSDIGVQRRHDESRSREIAEYVRYGYPWSDLSSAKRDSGEYQDLRKPGWLPTAIVVNILKPNDHRNGRRVAKQDLIAIENKEPYSILRLPTSYKGEKWTAEELPPIEVIDGQHRLWAFDQEDLTDGFELPVVAFHGLDISWQAYLFWTINIKPKKINASLAFDLYPLLRTEDWLEKFEGHSIYRETRAQELVEALWVSRESPWHQWINMLGESGLKKAMVSQSAWVRSLLATYVKSWEGRGVRIGGLFGAPTGESEQALPWSRAQQAAFLIAIGSAMKESVRKTKAPWAESLRKHSPGETEHDPAFYGGHSLFTTDQGIRGFLIVTNDLFYLSSESLKLRDWENGTDAGASDEKAVSQAVKSLKNTPLLKFADCITAALGEFDWRTSAAPGLKESDRVLKTALRGGSGYKEIRRQLLNHLAKQSGELGVCAKEIRRQIGAVANDG